MKEDNVRKLSLFVPSWYHLVSITHKYPLLPVGIIQSAIEACNTQVAIYTFSEMNRLIRSVSSLLEERREKSKEVIEIILLEHKKFEEN
jgi:hypothetical protein